MSRVCSDLMRRLRANLWQPPRAHGEIQRERTVGPLELFYDLVVVVLVAQAAHHLAGHLDAHGVGEFLVVFTLVWIAWFNGTLHHDLHGRDDARSRSGFLGQVLLLVPLGAFIPEAGGAHGGAFAIDAALLFGFFALLWWTAGRGDDRQFRATTRRYVGVTVLAAVVLAASAALPAGARLITWAVVAAGYLVMVALVFLRVPAGVLAAAMQVTDALTERFGAFVIIVLGETVTGVVTGLSGDPTNPTRLAVGLVAIVVGFGSWWTYFDFAGHREPFATPRATAAWLFSHLPLTAAIAAMGATMARLMDDSHAARTAGPAGWMLGGGALVLLAAIAALLTSLRDWDEQGWLLRPVAGACLLAGLAALGIGLLRPAPLVLVTLLVVVFSGPWIFAVVRRAARG